MSVSIPEKTSETLFIRYFMQGFGALDKGLQFYGPSTREEFSNGYDTKFSSLTRELILQFKKPTFKVRNEEFSIKLNKHQHQNLHKYPHNTAFYVFLLLKNLPEMNEIIVNLKRSEDFLKHYLCIDCRSIHAESNEIIIKLKNISEQRDKPDYYQKIKLHEQKVQSSIKKIYKGHNLLKEFKDDKTPIGGLIFQRKIYNYSFKLFRELQNFSVLSDQSDKTAQMRVEEAKGVATTSSLHAVSINDFSNFDPVALSQIRHSI